MHQVQTLQAQLAELDRRIKAARSRERNAVLAQVRELVTSYALTAREIFGQGYSDRAKLFTVGVKYRDPATGATWSGRGRAPAWIVGRDRTAFLIRSNARAWRGASLHRIESAPAAQYVSGTIMLSGTGRRM